MVGKRFNRLELRELIENRIGTKVEPSSLEELENSLGGFDSFTSALKTGYFEQKLTRRDFAKMSCSMLAILTGLPVILQSCATTGLIKEEGPVHYPKLSGHKIQSPEHYGLEGCMTGIWAGSAARWQIENYEAKVGKKPTFLFIHYYYKTSITHGIFDMNDIYQCGKERVIPFITLNGRNLSGSSRSVLKDVYNGVYDNVLKETAQKLKKYGDEHGGFFIRTMREMNLKICTRTGWPPWGGNAKKFKRAWNHIWNIFEQEGTNEYATWVFNPFVGPGPLGDATLNIKKYLPDFDKFDWIGGNAYNFGNQSWGTDYSFKHLFGSFAKFALKHCPDKPVMACNTGTYEGSRKPKWTSDMFETLESKYRHFKAIGIWSQAWKHLNVARTDMRIDSSPESLEAWKTGCLRPHFLGKIPYRNH